MYVFTVPWLVVCCACVQRRQRDATIKSPLSPAPIADSIRFRFHTHSLVPRTSHHACSGRQHGPNGARYTVDTRSHYDSVRGHARHHAWRRPLHVTTSDSRPAIGWCCCVFEFISPLVMPDRVPLHEWDGSIHADHVTRRVVGCRVFAPPAPFIAWSRADSSSITCSLDAAPHTRRVRICLARRRGRTLRRRRSGHRHIHIHIHVHHLRSASSCCWYCSRPFVRCICPFELLHSHQACRP